MGISYKWPQTCVTKTWVFSLWRQQAHSELSSWKPLGDLMNKSAGALRCFCSAWPRFLKSFMQDSDISLHPHQMPITLKGWDFSYTKTALRLWQRHQCHEDQRPSQRSSNQERKAARSQAAIVPQAPQDGAFSASVGTDRRWSAWRGQHVGQLPAATGCAPEFLKGFLTE